jgi:hypothetical protein
MGVESYETDIRPLFTMAKAQLMREIASRGESVWISAAPKAWFDAPIERTVSKSVAAEYPAANSPLYVGYRNIKIYGPRAIYVALGATYAPARRGDLIIEATVLKSTEKIAPDPQLNHEIAELILTEAVNTLAQYPVLRAGTLRFDKMHIHPVDYTLKAWEYAVRVLIGLLSITDYETLSDEDIVSKIVHFAGVSPSHGDSLLSKGRFSPAAIED